jgi:hypothetical protein
LKVVNVVDFSNRKEIKMFTKRSFMLLVVGALVSTAALTLQEAVATATLTSDIREAHRMQQSQAADTARWTAMGEYYQQLDAARSFIRSRAADIARWTASSEYYQQLVEAESRNLERARAADAARWAAMGEYFQQMNAASGLSRAQTAEAARWTAMAEYYKLNSGPFG